MTTFCNHLCSNCSVWLEPADGAMCPPCVYLAHGQHYTRRMWGETEGLVNRRWSMRFNRGELPDQRENAGVLWETKRKLQTW